jgi:hypothetical protein
MPNLREGSAASVSPLTLHAVRGGRARDGTMRCHTATARGVFVSTIDQGGHMSSTTTRTSKAELNGFCGRMVRPISRPAQPGVDAVPA